VVSNPTSHRTGCSSGFPAPKPVSLNAVAELDGHGPSPSTPADTYRWNEAWWQVRSRQDFDSQAHYLGWSTEDTSAARFPAGPPSGYVVRFSSLTLTVAAVNTFVAACAHRDQIRIFISALMTAHLLVMDLQVLLGAAALASPAVPLHHSPTELLVGNGIQPQAWVLRKHSGHRLF
jgi:hypothetical protein